jgi:1-aminocyclopropane-1-carboxylate deaminase/D-cysteine desulfhydrase-like pyridoxal-dependent ACC family enzyme
VREEARGVTAEAVLGRIELRHDQIGLGYGRETEAGSAAARLLGERGLLLDPTYTAKAAAGLLAEPPAAEGEVLFWHTLSAVEPLVDEEDATLLARMPAPFRRYLERA